MGILSIFNPHERFAHHYLKKQGLKSITHNYLCQYGEIDLIMQEKSQLIFIEVRYRKRSKYGNALESVTAKKQQKIIRTAQYFLIENAQWENFPMRFDIFAITGAEINWVKNAF